MTHWSCRTLAKSQGVSKSTINTIWQAHNLKPHRMETFKLSRDPKFMEKLTDVVGLYLNPPQQAIVLCVDEKSQIQALDRTQPGLPLKKGRCGTMTHDYKRHGTTTLFAALEIVTGQGDRPMLSAASASGIPQVLAHPQQGVPGHHARCMSSWTIMERINMRTCGLGSRATRASYRTLSRPAPVG